MFTDNRTLYTMALPVPVEYEPAVQDALRLTIIQLTMFLMYTIGCPQHGATVYGFATMQLFMLLGVAAYWLVFRKIVRFKFQE